MKYKMRGFIDPYTLGILISIIGAATAHSLHEQASLNDVKTRQTLQHSIQDDKSTEKNVISTEAENDGLD